MRKIIPSILITLILANIFAPFSFEVKKGALSVKQNVAEAKFATGTLTIKKRTKNSIDVHVKILREESEGKGLFLFWSKDPFKTEDYKGKSLGELENLTNNSSLGKYQFDIKHAKDIALGDNQDQNDFDHTILELEEDTTYYLILIGFFGTITTTDNWFMTNNIEAKTTKGDEVDDTETSVNFSNSDFLPSCGIGIGGGTIMGCVSQVLYWGIFTPATALFGLGGKIFDKVFNYSIKDTSYRNDFVLQGWGLVRDFVNMFFIFVLLYIAISTILNTHGFKTKEMIVNVVIIGLLINFSLFTTQVIIDASNILARVFYNSETIKIKKDNGKTVVQPEEDGTIPISEALVSKVDVQKFILDAKKANLEKAAQAGSGDSIGIATFILITLLATAVCIIGFIVFLSVGLMMISRVIGLWLAMIFAPFAFFSYTVPAMQGWEFVGWKHWWSDTLKMAFLAPIFIFFLYLIIGFLNVGLTIGTDNSGTGLSFMVSLLVPFIFLMILLWQAKSIAKTMSGKLGQSITGGVAAIGGMALGGAALGAAFAGRTLIGRTMGAASRSDSAKALGKHKVELREYNTKLAEHKKKQDLFNKGKISTAPVWTGGNRPTAPTKGQVIGQDRFGRDIKYKNSILTKLGGSLNAKQTRIEKSDHEAHELDSVKDKRYKGTDWKSLSGTQQNNVREDYIKDNRGKNKDEVEEKLRQTGFGSGVPIPNGQALTEAQRKIVNDETTKVTGAKFDHIVEEASKSINTFNRNLAKVNTASFDARNISQMKSSGRGGVVARFAGGISAGLIAGIAMGVRTGLKNSGINHGSGQNDFLKDISHTITEALKSTKINVKVEESHGKSGSDAHAGGHGGGHH